LGQIQFGEANKPDERMTAAIIDRLIYNNPIALFNGESYRYKVQKMKGQQNRQKR